MMSLRFDEVIASYCYASRAILATTAILLQTILL
jgi:hypothetical protein